jgi:hypothetical protein
MMSSGQITCAHQEFIHNFPACEFEGMFEELCPFFSIIGNMRIQPMHE